MPSPSTVHYDCGHRCRISTTRTPNPTHCLSCSLVSSKSQSTLFVQSYNADIRDATLLATSRASSVSNKRDKDEIISLAKRKVRELTGKRNGEIERIWTKFAKTWNGGSRKGCPPGGEEKLSVVLERNRDWLIVPKLVWRDASGVVTGEETVTY